MTTKIHRSHLALLKLIEKDGNNCCVDCGSTGTRWASWNLGIFLCIRCAGIHRNLGVHISKVKSVDLDSWTAEQMQSIESMGNKKSQKIYEAALPDFFMRPQTNYAVEEFIRAKYQYKRYCIPNETSECVTTDNPIEMAKTKPKNEDSLKNLVDFEICDEKHSTEGSEDSLSDPEYLVQQKQQSKSCHKVYSENDLISFQPSSNTSNNQDMSSLNNKSTIMSLYSRPNETKSYQLMGHDVSTNQHRSYGSSAYDSSHHSTTNIPSESHTNYLRQIQDKLTNLKVNLTAKFRQYEPPSGATSSLTASSFHTSTRGTNAVTCQGKQDSGQTLSPDLWR